MKLLPDYGVENLWWLGVFIHEACRIWQRNTGRHRTGETDYRLVTHLKARSIGQTDELYDAIRHK